jgi:hypothetical protein
MRKIHNLEGAIVECGVVQGGSLALLLSLIKINNIKDISEGLIVSRDFQN